MGLGLNQPGVNVSGDLSAAPWVNGNSFAIGSELGAFNAIDVETEDFTWQVRFFDLATGGLQDGVAEGFQPAALSDGRFAFQTLDGPVIAYDPRTGESQYIVGCATDDFETCQDSGEP